MLSRISVAWFPFVLRSAHGQFALVHDTESEVLSAKQVVEMLRTRTGIVKPCGHSLKIVRHGGRRAQPVAGLTILLGPPQLRRGYWILQRGWSWREAH